MPWADRFLPATMTRLAVVAPNEHFRTALVAVADAGTVQLEVDEGTGAAAAALRRLASAGTAVTEGETSERVAGEAGAGNAGPGAACAAALLSALPPDLELLEQRRCTRLLAGESELERRTRAAVTADAVTAAAGWAPLRALPGLSARLTPLGAAVVRLRAPAGSEPPTLLRSRGLGASFRPLVELYTTVPYRDVDPSGLVGLAYVSMFGMMFGDVGHGALLVLAAAALRLGRPRWAAPARRAWPFVLGAGVASIGFGFAYGEAFGPTGAVPVLWLAPLDHPTALLAAAVADGAVLLAIAYAIGSVNRWREAGPLRAAVAGSGLAGSGLYAGLALVGAGWYLHRDVVLLAAGGTLCGTALLLVLAGLLAEAGLAPVGVFQASIETFDTVVRLGSNVVSFARLGAFGLTHAALGWVVWTATTSLWRHGPVGAAAAAVVFLAGNAIAFCLEALVAAVQALRLEYYELFSRIFAVEGAPFSPWHIPTAPPEELPCRG
jgi:V/A-type H+-transporting ATPase subunit I